MHTLLDNNLICKVKCIHYAAFVIKAGSAMHLLTNLAQIQKFAFTNLPYN